MTRIDLAYRKTAVEGANGFGLLIALFDTLAGNLKRAAEAERAGDLGKRTQEANHALLVIGCLEDWVLRGPGGELSNKLSRFYRNLRCSIVQAQARRSAADLEKQATIVLEIRQAWQQTDLRQGSPESDIFSPGT